MKTITTYDLSDKDILRWWSKINIDGPKMDHMNDNCWEWTERLHGKGYGRFTYGDGERRYSISSHRISWFLVHGDIPEGLHVLHYCDNRICARPKHLFLGTNGDNRRDSIAKGRAATTMHLITDEEVRRLRSLWESGEANQKELANQFGISVGAVGGIVHYQTRTKPLIPGGAPYIRKYRILLPDQVREIRKRYIPRDKTNGGKSLAVEFGVSYRHLIHIVQRQVWKDLTD